MWERSCKNELKASTLKDRHATQPLFGPKEMQISTRSCGEDSPEPLARQHHHAVRRVQSPRQLWSHQCPMNSMDLNIGQKFELFGDRDLAAWRGLQAHSSHGGTDSRRAAAQGHLEERQVTGGGLAPIMGRTWSRVGPSHGRSSSPVRQPLGGTVIDTGVQCSCCRVFERSNRACAVGSSVRAPEAVAPYSMTLIYTGSQYVPISNSIEFLAPAKRWAPIHARSEMAPLSKERR